MNLNLFRDNFENEIVLPEPKHIIMPQPYNIFHFDDQLILYNNIFDLLKFIINQKLFILPSKKYCGRLFRGGKLGRFQDRNGYLPVSNYDKDKQTDSNEGIFFNFTERKGYIILSPTEPHGISMCRKIKDYIDVEKKINLFLNLNNDQKPCDFIKDVCNRVFKPFKCNIKEYNQSCFYLSQIIQEKINRCILFYIVKLFCVNSKDLPDYNLLDYNYIIRNEKIIILKNNIPGYDDPGYNMPFTVEDLLKSWNFKTGVRQSYYNCDRCYIYFIMPVIDIMEQIINNQPQSFWDPILCRNCNVDPNWKVNLLGLFIDNTMVENSSNNQCNIIDGEFIIRVNNFQIPRRYSIFYPRTTFCNVKSYQYNPQNVYEPILTATLPLANVNQQHIFNFNGGNSDVQEIVPLSSQNTQGFKQPGIITKSQYFITHTLSIT
jgi:hypothetical protein